MRKKICIIFFILAFLGIGCSKTPNSPTLVIQLNWLHDPTFAGEYFLIKNFSKKITIREGGPNISPISEVLSGRAQFAVVGADIFLQAIDHDYNNDLICIFIDFQRNPVGWILHPDVAKKAGLLDNINLSPSAQNAALFKAFSSGKLRPGDKRGTETTSIWVQWKKFHKLSDNVSVLPVGFDSSIVLSAPPLAYPVYLNEEPFKLSENLGENIIAYDPAIDGIELYGNVIVTTKAFLKNNTAIVQEFQLSLQNSWEQVHLNRSDSMNEISKYYGGVSASVLEKQITKTVEFVFYKTSKSGLMDSKQGGRWEKTINALQESGLITPSLTLDKLSQHIFEIK